MRKRQYIFYDMHSDGFFDAYGNTSTRIHPTRQMIILLPSCYLLAALVSSNHEEQAYAEAIEQLGLDGQDEFYFLNTTPNLAYFYPVHIFKDRIEQLQQNSIFPPILIPHIFLQLPYLSSLNQEIYLLIALEEKQSFCCIIQQECVHFIHQFTSVSCETSISEDDIIQALAKLFPLFNFKGLLPKSIVIYAPLYNHKTTWLDQFFYEHWHLHPQYIQEIPVNLHAQHINHLYDAQQVFITQEHPPPLTHTKILFVSFCLLLVLMLSVPMFHYIQAYAQLSKKQTLNEPQTIATQTQNNMEFLIQNIKEDYFPIDKITSKQINSMRSIQNLYNFYEHYRSISKALFLFVQNLPREDITLKQIIFSQDNHAYMMQCEIHSLDYTHILNFIHQLKQTQAYKQIQIRQNTFDATHHQTLISILL